LERVSCSNEREKKVEDHLRNEREISTQVAALKTSRKGKDELGLVQGEFFSREHSLLWKETPLQRWGPLIEDAMASSDPRSTSRS